LKRISPTLKARIPTPENGWFEFRYSSLADGSLALLRATHDIPAACRKRTKLIESGWTGSLPNLFPSGTLARLSIFDGAVEAAAFEFELDSAWPILDRFPCGNWIVVTPHSKPGERNAKIYSTDGNVIREIALGDGIEHIQCDAAGTIWVGYSDEGIFGNGGWEPQTSLPPTSESRLGINRFHDFGTMTWAYTTDNRLADCYAMNVTPEAVWACYYTDFPILRVNYDGHTRIWENRKAGAHLLAINGEYLVLLGGYGDEARSGALLRLTNSEANTVAEFDFELHGLNPRALAYSGAWEGKLNFVHDDMWYDLSVDQIVRELMD
jgi:hypothetical protein